MVVRRGSRGHRNDVLFTVRALLSVVGLVACSRSLTQATRSDEDSSSQNRGNFNYRYDGAADFDEAVARETVLFTEAAYCSDLLVNWNCTVCHSFPGMRNVSVLKGKSRNVRGFVGIDIGAKNSDASVLASTRGIQEYGEVSVSRAAPNSAATSRRTAMQQARQGHEALVMSDASSQSQQHLRSTSYRKRNSPIMDPAAARRPVYSTETPRIVVTFSGTDPKSIKNWIDDLEAAPIAHVYGKEGCENCMVHRGFLATYEVVQDQIRAAVKSHLHYHPEARILITGHSLGGALATLCFLDLLSIHGDKVAFAPLYIYGTPRVGNAAFATYTASHGVPVFRVVHNRDPVPHLPFQAWGYVHPAREVFFDAPQTSFAVCDDSGEDPTCSDKFWVMPDLVHVYDHLSYLEVDYTKAYVQCLIGNEEDDENVEKWIWNPSHQA